MAGLRWQDYDAGAKPLGALHVHCQYDGQPLKTASGADSKARMVPVHPELAKVLSKWRSQGFSAVYGRLPTEEDFIVPDRRNMRARTHSQVTKAPDLDCAAVEIEDKGTHGFRRYFITYARADGASADVLERITHNRRGGISTSTRALSGRPCAARCAVSRSTSTAGRSSTSGPRATGFGTLLWTPTHIAAES